jgi:HD superfamily phosphohydrolase
MKIIHCNLWGDIEVSDLALQIIDTPHFQRLHYIKQTGMSYKVFPGANTSRFEHSIGVYGITRTLLDHLLKKQPELAQGCDERLQELICIAGLVHDIGHGPFSHLFDYFLEMRGVESGWEDHETRGIDVLSDLIVRYQIPITPDEIQFIEKMVSGTVSSDCWYHAIINNKESGLDMDKMDYVLRDSMNFGMKIHFDPLRIIRNSRVIEGELCFCDRIKDEIITVFLIRNKMNRFIYRHKRVCLFESVLLYHLNSHLYEDVLEIIHQKDVKGFLRWTDAAVLFRLPDEIYDDLESRCVTLSSEDLARYDTRREYIDREWAKIKKLWFYVKKDPQTKFRIGEDEWNLISCY